MLQGNDKSSSRSNSSTFSRNLALISAWRNSALGGTMMVKILDHLRQTGDVQTIASFICVLGTSLAVSLLTLPPNGPPLSNTSTTCHSTPSDQGQGYCITGLVAAIEMSKDLDRSLYCYADMLYRWGIMSRATEVLKHIPRPTEIIEKLSGDENSIFDVCIACNRCGNLNSQGNKENKKNCSNLWCPMCNEFSLRCVICQLVLRTPGRFCLRCGHGGHSHCLLAYFGLRKTTECASGCGCQCSNRLEIPDAAETVSLQKYNRSEWKSPSSEASSSESEDQDPNGEEEYEEGEEGDEDDDERSSTSSSGSESASNRTGEDDRNTSTDESQDSSDDDDDEDEDVRGDINIDDFMHENELEATAAEQENYHDDERQIFGRMD